MICALDVDYQPSFAQAAALVFDGWSATRAAVGYVARRTNVAAYEPGAFYKRELPCLLAALQRVQEPIDLLIVDSYVTLDHAGTPGLGQKLYEALDGKIPVVGVAKTSFKGSPHAREVSRNGAKPLYVTQVGYDIARAGLGVVTMAGRFRIPDLLKQVDHLARGLSLHG